MSEENLSTSEEGPDASKLDASLKIDSASLSSDEADFARQMGFDGDEEDEAPPKPTPVAAEAATGPAPVVNVAEDDPAAADDHSTPTTETEPEAQCEDVEDAEDAEEDAETMAGEASPDAEEVTEDIADGTEDQAEAKPEAEALEFPERPEPEDPDSGDLEEIFPRAAADGIQSTLEARASTLLQRDASHSLTAPINASVPASPGGPSSTDNSAATEAAEASLRILRVELEERDTELQVLRASAGGENATTVRVEKENEALQSELDAISIDRDHLIDQLAVTSGKLVQSTSHAEKLEASLRAARGALTPLPEGERALRAEVIGLRGRIEESREEYQALVSELSQSATELAIAKARVEDRQHEVSAYIERAEALDQQMAENDEKLATTIARHRELLALSARLQADNNELRSAQAALEETLQARDLEILAREEHLTVTRQGLSARDAQLVDMKQRLEEQKQRCESQDADLQRAEIERNQLSETIAHRESRIATLTETLARIEQAMGHPLPQPDSASREMPQAEWSRPVLAQDTIRTKPRRPRSRPPGTPRATTPVIQSKGSEVEPSSDVTSEPEPARPAREATVEADAEVEAGVEARVEARIEVRAKAEAEVAAESEPEISVVVESAPAQQIDVEILEAIPDEADDATETCTSESLLTSPSPLPPILSHWRDRRFAEVTGGVGPGTVHGFLAERLQSSFASSAPSAGSSPASPSPRSAGATASRCSTSPARPAC